MSALIVYFSQNGATQRMAGEIANGLREKGVQVVLHDVTAGNPPDATSFDCLGVGAPVYIQRPAFPILDYTKALPPLDGRRFFSFLTYGGDAGRTPAVLRDILRRKKGRDIGFRLFRGKNHFTGFLRRGYVFAADQPDAAQAQKARAFGSLIGDRLASRGAAPDTYPLTLDPVFLLERFLTNRFFVTTFHSRFFFARKDKCKGCGRCARTCPEKNIVVTEKTRPRWGSQCILCGMCEVRCPNGAVRSCIDLPVFAPFVRYNILKIKKIESSLGRAAGLDAQKQRPGGRS